MSLTITNGYLINKVGFQMFDEIITFINEYGNKFVALAKGSRKITSHNARNLVIGNYCEFQFFLARNDDKISKLLKAVAIKSNKWPNLRQSFITLHLLVNKLIYPNKKNFEFYEKMLSYTNDNNISDLKAELIVLQNYCKLSGINLYTKNCVMCHSNKISTISFVNHGLLCQNCAKKYAHKKIDIKISKLCYFLFNEQYEQIDQYIDCGLLLIKYLKQYIYDNVGIFLKNQ